MYWNYWKVLQELNQPALQSQSDHRNLKKKKALATNKFKKRTKNLTLGITRTDVFALATRGRPAPVNRSIDGAVDWPECED